MHVLVVSEVVRACYVRSLIAPADVVAAMRPELAAADLQALRQLWVASQSVAKVEERRLDLEHRRVETGIGHPESHCGEFAGVKDEARDEHCCCCCCCIDLERCFLVDVVVLDCDYSSQKASEEEGSITS